MKWQQTGENCIMRGFTALLIMTCDQRDEVEEDEVGGACDAYGMEENCTITGFWYGSLEERAYLEDPSVDGR